MSKSLSISLSDAQYEALQVAAAQAHQTPEELIATTVAERFGGDFQGAATVQTPGQEAKERLLARLREQGLLVNPKTLPPYPGAEDLPPRGSPERAQLEEEIGEELSDALESSGLSILDLIERR